MELSANEIAQLEDVLRAVELGDKRMLAPSDWENACLKVGTALGQAAEIVFTDQECWAIIRGLSVFATVGGAPVGLSLKTKLYTQLAHLDFLDVLPDAEEVEYASESPAEDATVADTDSDPCPSVQP